jgi:antitoxin component YwqK of YwqJK toxin-antitoxin module
LQSVEVYVDGKRQGEVKLFDVNGNPKPEDDNVGQ